MSFRIGAGRGAPPAAIAGSLALWFASGVTAAGPPPAEAGPPAESAAPVAPQGAAAAPRGPFCPVCGAANPPGSRFCLRDGVPIPALDPGRLPSRFTRAFETYSPEEIQEAVRKAAASVVRIRGQTDVKMRQPVLDQLERTLFIEGHLETFEGESHFAGSGFAAGRGEIVTNAHVASPYGSATRLIVETGEGRTFPARLVGLDRASDLALLKIDTASLEPLEWADPDTIGIGDEAWAIGNPLDLGISLTRGTISTVGRVRVGLNQVESFVHTDAFITHGNSGGPLVNVIGRVVGVNDLTFVQGRSHGYAIPAPMARFVVQRLRDGRYARGFLGLHVRAVDAQAIETYALKRRDGLIVESVLPGTPAAGAGFRRGDLVFGINGRLATSSYLMQEAVSSVGPGAEVALTIERGGAATEIKTTTSARPDEPRVDPLADLERYLAARFEAGPSNGGVVIRIPGAFSQAFSYGFKDGDRLESVLAAQDWADEPLLLSEFYRKAHPVKLASVEDLRGALRRAYLGGRMGAAFHLRRSGGAPIVWVAFDERWPIVF